MSDKGGYAQLLGLQGSRVETRGAYSSCEESLVAQSSLGVVSEV